MDWMLVMVKTYRCWSPMEYTNQDEFNVSTNMHINRNADMWIVCVCVESRLIDLFLGFFLPINSWSWNKGTKEPIKRTCGEIHTLLKMMQCMILNGRHHGEFITTMRMSSIDPTNDTRKPNGCAMSINQRSCNDWWKWGNKEIIDWWVVQSWKTNRGIGVVMSSMKKIKWTPMHQSVSNIETQIIDQIDENGLKK